MLDLNEVYTWLNQYDPTHIDHAGDLSVRQMHNTNVLDNHRKSALKDLIVHAENSFDAIEKAEIYVEIGKYYSSRFDPEGALANIRVAVDGLDKKNHRYGVVKWIQGVFHWQLRENEKAYGSWKTAVSAFEEQRDARRIARDPKGVMWYEKALEKMRIECAKTCEDAFNWMYKWEVSTLDVQAKKIVDEMTDQINRTEYAKVADTGLTLAKISRFHQNPTETAEAGLILGLAFHRMGQMKPAIEFLKKSRSLYTPQYYYQGICSWMIGAAAWDLGNDRALGLRSWTDALEYFDSAMRSADRYNLKKKREWLEIQIPIMRRALDERNIQN